ncbi:hypothetical protein COLO4_04338 [Corchorus olitorius]|uniref:Uncharacterized protein n=1 Tax=Corchorus olitorius TaxID=93759 RepID=A0A1R3KUI9_9ROSI|nr:hypothetical protein COLO4_04338 [Corchorus olitorius]
MAGHGSFPLHLLIQQLVAPIVALYPLGHPVTVKGVKPFFLLINVE